MAAGCGRRTRASGWKCPERCWWLNGSRVTASGVARDVDRAPGPLRGRSRCGGRAGGRAGGDPARAAGHTLAGAARSGRPSVLPDVVHAGFGELTRAASSGTPDRPAPRAPPARRRSMRGCLGERFLALPGQRTWPGALAWSLDPGLVSYLYSRFRQRRPRSSPHVRHDHRWIAVCSG